MSIESLLTTKVIEAVKQCYDADVDKDKVQLQATRKEFAGDLTVVVFPFTRFSKKSPEETGKELGGYLKQHIEERDFSGLLVRCIERSGSGPEVWICA